MARILLIDDDRDFADFLQHFLAGLGHEVRWFDQAEQGLRLLAAREPFEVVLLDNRMPGMSGLEFLAELKKTDPSTPVILMTGAHNDRTAIQAINLGAHDYVLKPTGDEEEQALNKLRCALEEALALTRRPRPVPLPQTDRAEDDSVIVGRSKRILDVLRQVGRYADLDETVLILGETGTGKDLVARAIHTNSRRKDRPFVVINCTALNENLLDDELFGHEVAAFTGADKLRKGRFEHANHGTLLLDEVGDMPLPLQAKLLRVLENREVVRIGSNEPIKVDVRVLAATHCDLQGLVREGKFREDLFYRLEGMTIHLPPLRERKEDVELLARRFLSRLVGGPELALHPTALERLRAYPWPGNVRQLHKVLCRAVGACRGLQIMPADLDFGEMERQADSTSAEDHLRRLIAWAWGQYQSDLWPQLQQLLERELLRYALTQPGLSQVQLARRLGMARNTLRARLEQYGLHAPETSTD